jgi:hypothetical protein
MNEPEYIPSVIREPWRCPVCGWKCMEHGGLKINGFPGEINGTYCERCWAESISRSIPRMLYTP